jgi:hypothetical protein
MRSRPPDDDHPALKAPSCWAELPP